MERKAWFCPQCNKHHAPHCDTCPEPVQVRPLPGITIPYKPPSTPAYDPIPWVTYPATCVSAVAVPDHGHILIN